MKLNFAGGSFSPPLTAESLAAYKALADGAAPQVRDAMGVLITLAETYRDLAAKDTTMRAGTPHTSGRGTIVKLAVAVADAIDPLTPWDDELKMYGAVFDRLPTGTKPYDVMVEIAPDGTTRDLTIVFDSLDDASQSELTPGSVVEDPVTKKPKAAPGWRFVRAVRQEVTNQQQYKLRNAAHHLLWYATELSIGREPITNDKL